MASYGMNDVKNGMKILVNAEPAVITDTEYVKLLVRAKPLHASNTV